MVRWAMVLGLVGCSRYGGPTDSAGATEADDTGGPSTTEGDADTDADGDTDADADGDTDADTDTDVTLPWNLVEMQRLTTDDAFSGHPPPAGQWEHGPGIALGDLDGDGDLDAIYAVPWDRSFPLRNEGGVLVVDDDMTMDGGELGPATSVALGDLDDDGDLDAVLTGDADLPDRILENDGAGRFTRIGLTDSEGTSLSPALGDVDGDGDLDLLIPGFADAVRVTDLYAGAELGEGTHLWRNDGALRFTDVTASTLPADQLYDLSYQATFVDFDQDGDLDVYVSNDFANTTLRPSQIWENDGRGVYTALSDADHGAADLYVAAMGASVGDPNQDGWPDLYVSNTGTQEYLVSLGSATAGWYYRASQVAGVEHPDVDDSTVGWGSRFQDMDGDGDEDLLQTYGAINDGDTYPQEEPDVFYLGVGDGTFVDATAQYGFDDPGFGRSLVVGDLDRDARPDVVVAGRGYVVVYHGCEGAPTITLALDAGAGNHEGVGAEVRVQADDLDYTRWNLPGTIFGMSAPELYLGIGGASEAALTVTWPDGTVTTAHAAPGDRLTLTP